MAGNDNGREISRRQFTATLGAVAGLTAGANLLTPAEVATMFRVDPKTVTRWARAGKISSIRTIGGHRRFRSAEVQRFLDAWQLPA